MIDIQYVALIALMLASGCAGNADSIPADAGRADSATDAPSDIGVSDALADTVIADAFTGAVNDPGYGTGLWLPAGTTNLFVVDQMNTGGVGNVDYIPGCVNSVTADFSASPCALNWSQVSGDTIITMAQGNVLSIRFPSRDTLSTYGSRFNLKARDGLNTPHVFSMWLTTDPTASYEGTPDLCKNVMFGRKTTSVSSGSQGCPVTPGTLYYLNIRIDDACSGAGCTFALQEDATYFKY